MLSVLAPRKLNSLLTFNKYTPGHRGIDFPDRATEVLVKSFFEDCRECVALDLRKDSDAAVYRGQPLLHAVPDCTLTVSDVDLVELATGKLSGNKVCRMCS